MKFLSGPISTSCLSSQLTVRHMILLSVYHRPLMSKVNVCEDSQQVLGTYILFGLPSLLCVSSAKYVYELNI
jgi:hypothetical protein